MFFRMSVSLPVLYLSVWLSVYLSVRLPCMNYIERTSGHSMAIRCCSVASRMADAAAAARWLSVVGSLQQLMHCLRLLLPLL